MHAANDSFRSRLCISGAVAGPTGSSLPVAELQHTGRLAPSLLERQPRPTASSKSFFLENQRRRGWSLPRVSQGSVSFLVPVLRRCGNEVFYDSISVLDPVIAVLQKKLMTIRLLGVLLFRSWNTGMFCLRISVTESFASCHTRSSAVRLSHWMSWQGASNSQAAVEGCRAATGSINQNEA